ncbi:MAG TPA: 1-acyl-sn-glycerol-3-phosphate acyltransferase [Phycisphaerales bacterium]|nr:1-acyl-sn-glycerol-3-phosphate acyltransferase [Phycisphaerales bacterium]HIN83547.1 1-acyl-sn-glycerol-3-phosphate acyltransferase [Phycisphaerales bacterium]HIO19729.1 1-acyl-sn-glycerol-3-phosphate acyltransferase [Phycisphaerales bacterium]HIO52067.1 1-acyl-sn-glycerol-3-phosphate acyltransferase [Phycisphaerales bacterium]
MMFSKFQLRRRAPGLSAYRILFWWTFMIWVMKISFRIIYGLRCSGREFVPRTGPIIFVANHQSNFDPPIIGAVISDRPSKGIARSTLLESKLLGSYISAFGVISIKRGESDLVAIKKALQELAAGRCVMIFPEGTRTQTGEMGEFQRGFWLLLKKSKAMVLPVGIDGAFDAYPMGSKPKLRGCIEAMAGEAMSAESLLEMGEQVGTAFVRSKIELLMLQCKENIKKRSK